jgi:hypothetical protein
MRNLVLALCACTGCASDVVARYPSAPGVSGAIDIVLNDASRALTVEIDDQLVVDRATSRRAHVDGIPAGIAHVRIATGGRCEQGAVTERDVVVMPGTTATLVLPGPEPNHGCMVYDGLALLALVVEAVAIAAVEPGRTFHVR